MIIYVDVDNTICQTQGTDYKNATPIPARIAHINSLYASGNNITYWTARGSGSGIDHTALTREQLTAWGCKYSELRMGKPVFDLFIDDKVITANTYFSANLQPQ